MLTVLLCSGIQKKINNIKSLSNLVTEELEIFRDYEMLNREFFSNNSDVDVLVVGHTHVPTFRSYADGKTFINTGSWTKMFNLDFENRQNGTKLTYAKIICNKEKVLPSLNIWLGKNEFPYSDFS